MKNIILTLSLISIVGLSACTNMSDTQQRTMSGAAIGTAAGVGVGALTGGGLLWGAVGGAAIGAASGYVYDQHEKGKKSSSAPIAPTKSNPN